MISKVYSAAKSSFLFCIEELEADVRLQFGAYDFLLFSIHPSFPVENINHIIKKVFQTDNFVAFHAINAFKDDEIVEEAVTVCCFKFQKQGKINTYYVEDIANFKRDDTVNQTAGYFNQHSDQFHIILTSLCDGDISFFIDDVSKKLNYTSIDNIVGGVASGTEENGVLHTFQFIDGKIIKNGFIVLSFENVEGAIESSLGFKPYGITYKITKSEGTKLYAVDDGKSFSYMMQKMLNGLSETKKDVRDLWYTPLRILNEENGYTSTLRTVERVEDDYVNFFAPLKNGEYFKLSFASSEELIESDDTTAKNLMKKITEPEISFNFSCVARQYVLEEKQQQEVEIYTKNFNTHLFGFFTFGEIGPDEMYNKLKLYNETSFAVVMRER